MTTYRDVFPTEHITHFDLKGKDRTLTIKSFDVNGGYWLNGKRQRAIILYFEEAKKGLRLNTSIEKTIAVKLGYGPEIEEWIGKRITIYPTTDDMIRGEDKRCVRVRPSVPAAKPAGKPGEPVKADPAPAPVPDQAAEPQAEAA